MSELSDELLEGEEVAPDGGASSPEEQAIEVDLGRLQAERDDFRETLLRLQADFQNYKRRTEEERQKNAMFANLALVLNMLPIHDDLERALNNLDTKLAGLQWVEGVRQIARKFEGAMEASGVKEIRAEGEEFDPNLHEAIAQDAGEHNKVIRVVQKGYTMGERVIRPAMVIVGNGNERGNGQ